MAHVMTYDEIAEAARNGKPIYEELRRPFVREMKFTGVDFACAFRDYITLSECDEEECLSYNWNYRCWDEMPTEEELLNTPWKANPYRREVDVNE